MRRAESVRGRAEIQHALSVRSRKRHEVRPPRRESGSGRQRRVGDGEAVGLRRHRRRQRSGYIAGGEHGVGGMRPGDSGYPGVMVMVVVVRQSEQFLDGERRPLVVMVKGGRRTRVRTRADAKRTSGGHVDAETAMRGRRMCGKVHRRKWQPRIAHGHR